ncbi:hypothetical protein AAVH_01654 [Aphelenchoides avenae]|nr:hypothetical protein AAVH_01654 [Aphelenchus avenae]
MPNYILQLIDEFTNLKSTSQRFVAIYFYCDALFYVLYLTQFPMLAVYVKWLHSNYTNPDETRRASRRPKKSKLSLPPEDSPNKKEEFRKRFSTGSVNLALRAV